MYSDRNVVRQIILPSGAKGNICDDYCRDKTPEEVQQILDSVAEIVVRSMLAQMYRDDSGMNK